MANINQLAGQTAVYGLSSIIGRFLNYLLVPLYTYTFTTSEYGIVTEFYAYVVVLQILLTYGMETGFFRFSEKLNNLNTVFTTILTAIFSTSTLFIILVITFSKQISALIGYQNHIDYIIIFAFIIGIDSVTAIFFAKLRKQNKAKKFAIFKIINISLNISLNLFFIILCPILENNNASLISWFYNSSYGVGYIFVSNFIASFITLLLFFPEIIKIKIDFNSKLLKSILIYSLPLLITGLTGAVNEMADRILIKYLTIAPIGTENVQDYVMSQLGIYGANAKLAVIMMMFVQAFRYAAEPFFFSSAKTLDSDSLKNFADVMKYFIVLAFFMFLFILLNLDFIKYFINKDYFEGLNVVLPLFLSRILVGVFFILSFWYKLKDVTKYGIVIFTLGAFITVLFDFIFIPKFGYIAAAWTNFATYLVMVIVSFIWSRKYMKVPYQYITILLYILLALSIYYMSRFIDTSSDIFNILLKNLLILFYIFSQIIHYQNMQRNIQQASIYGLSFQNLLCYNHLKEN